MNKTDKAVLIDGLRKLAALAVEMADQLDGMTEKEKQGIPTSAPETAEPKKDVTREDVRGILAEKARTGFRAEVKALLTEFGADKLSDITEPDKLAALAERAEVIGSA